MQAVARKEAECIAHFISHVERNGNLILHKESGLDKIHISKHLPHSFSGNLLCVILALLLLSFDRFVVMM